MDGSRKRRRSESEEPPSRRHGVIDTDLQPHTPQPVGVGLRQAASYEHSSTWMAGQSQAHFGDIYHISNATSTSKAEDKPQIPDGSLTSWLTGVVLSTWQRRERARTLRNRLGEWAHEARSSTGDYLTPVLSRAAFEKHLIDHNATFEPLTPSTSSFAWAQLLHVFDIHPGQGIIVWRPTKPEEDPLLSGSLSLAIDGQSLCHILNLYTWDLPRRSLAIPAVAGTVLHASTRSGVLRIQIGTTKSERTILYYEAKPSATPYGMFPLTDNDRTLYKDDLMNHYLKALHEGTNDDRLMLPHFDEPLEDRIRALARVAGLLATKTLQDERPMVNGWWLEQASRIKRRVTTNGGNDRLLEESLLKSLAVRKEVRRAADSMDQIRYLVRDLVMYKDEAFESYVKSRRVKSTNRVLKRVVEASTRLVVEELVEQMGETWISNLASAAPDVAKILNMASRIESRFINSLVVDTDDWLWESSCQVPG